MIKRENVPSHNAKIKEIIRVESKTLQTKTQYKRRRQMSRRIDRENRQYIEALKLTDESLNQYLNADQSNARRAVGLKVWDIVTGLPSEQFVNEYCTEDQPTSSPKQEKVRKRKTTVGDVISSVINEFAEHNPELLDHYRKGWNDNDTSTSGSTIMSTLKKRMRRDYQMTDYCITNRGYFSPYRATKVNE